MKTSLVRELTLYRYRYFIGYALFIVFVGALLLVDIGSIPNGINDREMQSVVASNSLNFRDLKPADIVNLPYHVLQKASISLFGLSQLSIRLPSLILAFLAAAALAITLNQWFRRNIAVLALIITASSVPFISMGRTGVASVFYMLLLLIILMSAVKLTSKSRGTFFWKLFAAISALLLLYMPLGAYAVFALLVAGAFHPHVRYQIKHTKLWQIGIFATLTLISLLPLIIAGIHDINIIEYLFGVDALKDKLTLAGLGDSLLAILRSLFLFYDPEITDTITPFLNLTTTLLIVIGLVRTLLDRHAARSYLILIWLAVSIPLLILNPTHFALLFVPCIILLAIGLEFLLREWYSVFPRNPYARIGALVPLSLIVVGLLAISITRYFYAYYYSDTSSYYHAGLTSIRTVLKPHVPTRLIVPAEHTAFYDILRKQYPQLTIGTSSGTPEATRQPETIALASSNYQTTALPRTIITSHLDHGEVLLRVYSRTQ